MTAVRSSSFRFADIEVQPSEWSVLVDGEQRAVEPKAFRLLLYLMHNPGRLIPKEELLSAVWNDAAVTENSLTRAIAVLRRILGDDPHTPRFIETVTTVGYRFICPVEEEESPPAEAPEAGLPVPVGENPCLAGPSWTDRSGSETVSPSSISSSRFRRGRVLLAAGSSALLLSLSGVIWYASQTLPPPHITRVERITSDPHWVAKRVMGTDGSRVLLSLEPPPSFGQVQAAGGEITTIPLRLPGTTPLGVEWLGPVSPDGNSILVFGASHSGWDPKKDSSDLWIAATTGSPVRYLTRTGLYGFSAAWSPDGKQVIYSTSGGKVCTIPSMGGTPRVLRTLDDVSSLFVYSPDGSKIRFTYHSGNGRRIWEMSTDGSNLHELLPDWRRGDTIYSINWTPDGDFFLFLYQEAHPHGNTNTPPFEIWATDERHGRIRRPIPHPIQLAASGSINWLGAVPSRDGRTIYSQGGTFRGELLGYDRESGQLQPYLGGRSIEMLDFSRDGKYVTYSSFPEGILWQANRDGTGVRQVAKAPIWYPMNPHLSPDGSQIVFFDRNPGPWIWTMYLVSSQGGTPVRVTSDDSQEADPTWSPDGRRLAYWASSAAGNTPAEIRILDLTSRKTTVLPRAPAPVYSPRWSPDGRYLACSIFDGTQPDNGGLEIYDFESAAWKVLLRSATPDWPTWSADSRMIYYLGEDAVVYRIAAGGGRPERVTSLAAVHPTGFFHQWFGLDPSDNLLWLRDAGTTEVYALTLEK